MSAFIPNRRQPEVTERALAKVREDKEREAGDGFDGTWVAHPDLVPVAREVFDRRVRRPGRPEAPAARGRRCRDPPARRRGHPGRRDHRGGRARRTSASGSATSTIGCGATVLPPSTTSWRTWRRPRSPRSQLWQWRRHGVALEDGRVVDGGLVRTVLAEELDEAGRADDGPAGRCRAAPGRPRPDRRVQPTS